MFFVHAKLLVLPAMSSVEKAEITISKRTMKSVKEELFRWICEKHATNSFLDRRMIREKALDLTNTRRLNGTCILLRKRFRSTGDKSPFVQLCRFQVFE